MCKFAFSVKNCKFQQTLIISLVVLSAQSGDDDRQELLPRHLGLHGEGVAHLGGDDDGQAVGQQLHM